MDYSHFPEAAYFIDLGCIDRPGNSPLLEVPLTVVPQHYPTVVERVRALLKRISLGRGVMHRFFPQHVWLRPNGRNRRRLLSTVSRARADGRDYIEFFLHSSELMPAGSPTFPSSQSIEVLYRHMEALFEVVSQGFEGLTLEEYRRRVCSRTAPTVHDARQ